MPLNLSLTKYESFRGLPVFFITFFYKIEWQSWVFVSIHYIFYIGVSSGSISNELLGNILRFDFGTITYAVYLNSLVAFFEKDGN